MALSSDGRIWFTVTAVNAIAFGFALLAVLLGVTGDHVFAGLSIFVYLETFIAVLWYTMETRRMQVTVAQQTSLLASNLRSSLHESMRNTMMEINQLFLSHPHLRPYFYGCQAFTCTPGDDTNSKI
jgi:hypothetical protein